MKSFLLKANKPIISWGSLPQGIFYEGIIPEGHDLAVCPSENIVILDVDKKGDKNGFNHIPSNIYFEIRETFNYQTKSGGGHYWIRYMGNKTLKNTSTKLGLDLRIGAKGTNNGGYVKYPHTADIRECVHLIKESSNELNKFLEDLFS